MRVRVFYNALRILIFFVFAVGYSQISEQAAPDRSQIAESTTLT
jgi:hypothetical protein